MASSIVLMSSVEVSAQAVQHVSQHQAQGLDQNLPEVLVYQGYGDTVIDFRGLNESVRQINIGDGSRLVFNSDDPSCLSHAAGRTDATCNARILYLKQIKPIVIDELYTSPYTELKAVTDNNIYTFKIVYSSAPPTSSIYKLQPYQEPKPGGKNDSVVDNYVTLRKGYLAGVEKGYINEELGQVIQNFLQKVYDGKPLLEAAAEEGLSEEAVDKLKLLGTLEDGSLGMN